MRDIREELEQEASFWCELITSLEMTASENELNRMREVMLLAEFKLAQIDTTH